MTPLRRSRLLNEITLFELARRSKICLSRLSYFERGLLESNPKEKKRLSHVSRVPVQGLFGSANQEGLLR